MSHGTYYHVQLRPQSQETKHTNPEKLEYKHQNINNRQINRQILHQNNGRGAGV